MIIELEYASRKQIRDWMFTYLLLTFACAPFFPRAENSQRSRTFQSARKAPLPSRLLHASPQLLHNQQKIEQMSATSPPHSPLPKRQKPNPTSPSQSASIEATMSAAEKPETPVTKVSAQPPLLIKKLSEKARLPTRGSAFAAGYDIYASKDTVVPARGKVLVDTDISMAVPEGTCSYHFHLPFLLIGGSRLIMEYV